ncbi:MAG: hypothetical protein GX992_00925 [Clostridium sp.]|nr:hypothetical protein [Clostridium sp.]
MNIYAVVDRLEDGNVVLVSDDYGLEVRIPCNYGDREYIVGERISITWE